MVQEPQPRPTPATCLRLRSKGTPGMGYEDGASFDAGYVSTANFWCTVTGGTVGPDDSYVHPHVCTARRICFAAPRMRQI
jgi:hypothetical protein